MPELTLNQLEAFISLVEFDKKLLDLDDDKRRIEQEQELIAIELKKLEIALKKYQETVNNVQKQVNILDLETKTLDNQLKQKQTKLERTSAPKEYFTLQDEIENIKQDRAKLDNTLLDLWQELETAQIDLKKNNLEIQNKKDKLLKEQEHLQHRFDFTKKMTDELTPKRPEFEKNVDSEVLEQYNSLRSKVKRPVVKAINNICSACSFTLSLSDLAKLNAYQLATCKECFRLLYLPEILPSKRADKTVENG